MTPVIHRAARVATVVAGAGVVAFLLGRRPDVISGPPPIVTASIAPAAPASAFAEPLFADPPLDVLPAGSASGPPQLLGIVGRLSDPLVMVRAADGAVLTIAPGEAAGGWALISVASDRATFRRGAEERVAVLPPREGPQ